MKRFSLPTLMLMILIGCSKSDTDPNPNPTPAAVVSKYFVVSSNSEFGGHISTYQKGEVIQRAYSVNQSPIPDRIADATLSDNRIYAVRATSSKVDVINADNMALVNTLSFSNVSSGNYFKLVEFVNNKIVVADAALIPKNNLDFISYIKIIDPQTGKNDSLPMTKNRVVRAMGASGNKLYLSLVTESLKPFVRVLDATTFSIIKDIDLNGIINYCTGFEFDKNGNVIVMAIGKIAIVSSTDLTVLKTKSIGATSINGSGESFTNSKAYCLDKDNSILYFLGAAAQPATAPFILKAYDLVSDEIRNVNPSFVNASSLAYDANQKLVLMGDYVSLSNTGGAVKMYNASGSLTTQFSVPTLPSEILIN